MIWATEYKHADQVKLLLSKGADISVRDKVGKPLSSLWLTIINRGIKCHVMLVYTFPLLRKKTSVFTGRHSLAAWRLRSSS